MAFLMPYIVGGNSTIKIRRWNIVTESRNGPKGFIIVLPGEIIEIPQDDDKSWLTLFYALPKEL